MAKVSIIIPSRHERFLQRTITSLLEQATGEVEIIPVLDGYWPDPPLIDDKRVTVLHIGAQRGMRHAINQAAAIARGEYLMKLDGHCLLARGFDEVLQQACDDRWIVIPRRYSLDAEQWTILDTGKAPIDAHYLSYPFSRPSDKTNSLHGNVWTERARARRDVLIDEEMSSQGSCWFMKRSYWPAIGPLDDVHYGTFFHEFQEIGLKCWLGGGQVMVNKRTWYAHLHKGKTYGTGYQFTNQRWAEWSAEHDKAKAFTLDHWLYDRWPARVHDFRWLLERFWPVPTWPADLDAVFRAIHDGAPLACA